jgi:Retrotransposon gag protein
MPIYLNLSTLFNEQPNSPDLPEDQEIFSESSENSDTEIMSVSLEIAEKLLIRFDGSKNKLHEFIDNCDKAISLVKPEYKPILLAIIETKLTDKARAIIRNRTFDEWKKLKDFLLDAYSERRTEGQWQLELHSLRQLSGDSVMSYANKVENCYIKLLNTLDPDLSTEAKSACTQLIKNQALNVFIRGLNRDLSILIKSRNPESLESAVALAVAEEQEQLSKQEMFRPFQSYCNICKKNNHSTSNCKFRNQTDRNIRHFQNSNPHSFRNNQNFNNFSKFHNQNDYTNHKVRHFTNNSQNNFSNNSQKLCRYCKNIGHVIEECRKRAYNNNMKSKFSNVNPTNSGNANNMNSNSRFTNSQNNQNNLNLPHPRQQTASSRGVHSVQAESQPSTSL